MQHRRIPLHLDRPERGRPGPRPVPERRVQPLHSTRLSPTRPRVDRLLLPAATVEPRIRPVFRIRNDLRDLVGRDRAHLNLPRSGAGEQGDVYLTVVTQRPLQPGLRRRAGQLPRIAPIGQERLDDRLNILLTGILTVSPRSDLYTLTPHVGAA